MKKIIIISLVLFMVSSCTIKSPSNNEEIKKELPIKPIPESLRMSDSPINSQNLDDYLFLDDVMYVDTRAFNQFLYEGHVAGFVNIPFYEMIAAFTKTDNILFTTEKTVDENGNSIALGSAGSYKPNYEESITIINELFPKNRKIVFIASAGVESFYLMSLLVQLGYNPEYLYNAGSFSNSLGDDIAYRELQDKKYFVEGIDTYSIITKVDYKGLTPIE